jgi:transcriptional regulator with XRE-family HTH domain
VETPNPVDVRVGARLRLRRNMLGLSQEKLGEAIGLTFQQVQKYERGANRIGASRLYELSRVLDVPVTLWVALPSLPRRSSPYLPAIGRPIPPVPWHLRFGGTLVA